jgi:arginyl-tRNA synthetase
METILKNAVQQAFKSWLQLDISSDRITFQKTKKEFGGDITLVVFPLAKMASKSPDAVAKEIGAYLVEHVDFVVDFNAVAGFLNIFFKDSYWLQQLSEISANPTFGFYKPTGKTVLVEYSSPNTNKPLHLGHIRNNLLGYAVAEILKANGHQVVKVQVINDRGIHICKSMLAWQKWGGGETPQSSGLKGDKLVGKYYVEFDKRYKQEIEELTHKGVSKEEAEKTAPLIIEAQEMLQKWEAGDKAVHELWSKMNGWCYDGFDITYKNLGVDFDKLYYESNTFLEGKKVIQDGLAKNIFFQKADGSVWIDLTKDGLDEKLLLRADGTAVYITQDIGTAILRYLDYPSVNQMIYTVGNEQDYHFKVLFLILQKLGYDWAKSCYHLSYGMVDLPTGKMKSREGTVVDADDLMEEMTQTAKEITEQLGKLEGVNQHEKDQLYQMIGLAALKYFMLKVDPKKRMMFNPEESVDFNGNTGPFIQYTHARIASILRKSEGDFSKKIDENITLEPAEKQLISLLTEFQQVIFEAGLNYSPALLANYVYELVKSYNSFYQSLPILKAEGTQLQLRLIISNETKKVIAKSMNLLGIQVPDRM